MHFSKRLEGCLLLRKEAAGLPLLPQEQAERRLLQAGGLQVSAVLVDRHDVQRNPGIA